MSASQHHIQAVCRALADPVRVRMLNIIRHRRELSALDMTTLFGLQRGELNHHVKFLERAHLITSRGVGVLRQYRYTDELTPFHAKLIDFLVSLEELPELRQDLDRLVEGGATALRRACPGESTTDSYP